MKSGFWAVWLDLESQLSDLSPATVACGRGSFALRRDFVAGRRFLHLSVLQPLEQFPQQLNGGYRPAAHRRVCLLLANATAVREGFHARGFCAEDPDPSVREHRAG